MDHLWAPWRLAYVAKDPTPKATDECFICRGLAEADDRRNLIVLRGSLDAVLLKEPRFERALFYRGSLLKRCGRYDRAIRDFRLAAEINPKNIDAVREVRLYDMRKRGPGAAPTGTQPSEPGGILGKFWKR